MKKYLLTLIVLVCAVTGAWAEVTVTGIGSGTITISSENAGDINTGLSIALNYQSISDKRIIVQGKVNLDDLTKIKSSTRQSWDNFTFDFSGLTEYPALNTWPKMWQGSAGYPVYILPKGCSGFDESMTTYVSNENTGNGIFNIYGDLQYIIIPASAANNPAYIYIYKRKGIQSIVTDLASDDKSYFTGNESKIEVLGLNGAGAESSWSALITNLKANGTWGSKISLLPYSVSGCDVTINIESAEAGQTLADLITTARAAVIAGGEAGICTLTVKGELTANDLIALGGTNMTGATRIDLSGATLASGVSIDDLQIPASLTSLVLPKNTTVNVGLESKMNNWTNLNYAYSPSTDPEQSDPTVADYVWVNKAGGMAAALDAESLLKGSKYIKVASKVALNANDVDFSSTTTVKYLDLRFANMTQDVSLSYVHAVAPQETGYRLILPDNWTKDEMTAFATDHEFASGAWNMAAIYSYSGTELNIYELKDGIYMTSALSNPRIMYDGTTAIKVVTTLDTNLLAALNAAASSVKTITVTASSLDALTFNNPNITTLNVEGLNKSSATVTAGTGCNSLTTLNVTGSTVASVVATGVSSLTTVNLNGTTISGETNLSNTGLTTFTTNSSTKLQGDINLMSTALTSLNTTAEIGTTTAGTGNILLNGCESLGSITLGSAQFKNGTSMIHIDKSTTEKSENKDAIDALSRTETVGESQVAVKTIFVPNGFESPTRIHPYDEVKDNVSAVAGSGANEDGDRCTITYDATTKVATVHTTAPGHFATMMETRYGSYPQGATFKFDATSQINEADLKALAGTINSYDYGWRSNYYYVDLYDLTATDALCNYQTGTITNVINWLRTNDRQFKGLILPKDHTQYGSGTTLIQDGAGTNTQLATCSEFIAYYKTKDEQGQDVDQKTFVGHVYNQSPTNADAYQASYEKMLSLVDAHTYTSGGNEVPEVKTDAKIVLITSNSATKLNSSSTSISGSTRIEAINNEMVGTQTGKASVYAYPTAPGKFAVTCTSTGLPSTPTEMLQINGAISDDDIAAINSFTDGPRVLDLRYANTTGQTGMITKAMLEALTNTHIEYILLPEGQTKAVVCGSDYSDLTGLKVVISSTSTNLVAYVKQAGSLAEARYLATGGSVTGDIFTPTQTGLQSVTLAGSLNAGDIAANTTTNKVNADGHWGSGSGNASSIALSSEQGTITTIDLEKAVFATQTDMNFSYAGLGSIQNITLPTSSSMTLIPAECFMGITSFDDLCIPYNYTKIDNKALYNTYMSHLTTTDASGALVDNGPLSYTFSKNLEEIGTKPGVVDGNGVYSLSETVFPQNRGVTDVYVLAHKVPKCYANAFPANMYYGWGGFKGGDFPYCREKYDNSSDGSLIFTVLHFPDEASYNEASDKESSYGQMKKYYTDVNKVYTKKEQTGAVDANGDPIAWPTFAELRRVYNQATDGITWYEWTTDLDENGEVQGGAQIPTAKNAITAGNGDYDYEFVDYEGWHQFVLSMATYVEPDKTVENEVIKNSYVQGLWYTLCIPFSLTEEQAYEILGIPASVDGVVENKLGDVKITESNKKLPDIRTLKSVTRKPGTTNEVTLQFSKNLAEQSNGNYLYWDSSAKEYVENGKIDGEKIFIRGGYPYLVRPYLPQGETVNNLGKYIMTHFANKFSQESSCMNQVTCSQDLAEYTNENKTGRFAKPYENHKVQAYLDVQDGSGYMKHKDGNEYYYTFVGQFWKQNLPKYSFYMVEGDSRYDGRWFRFKSGAANYYWNQYKCIIMATQKVEDAAPTGRDYLYTNSGLYRDNTSEHSVYPASSGTDAQGAYKFDGQLYIEFLSGIDDSDFTDVYNGGSTAKYIFTFDDFIQEFDENGNEVTAIDSLDGEDTVSRYTNGKVYNMSGQYVGDSLEGLGKGLYIVNGKKYIVK